MFTLIRVPNKSSRSCEFASKYVCLQTSSTHKVYVINKRKSRIRRFDEHRKSLRPSDDPLKTLNNMKSTFVEKSSRKSRLLKLIEKNLVASIRYPKNKTAKEQKSFKLFQFKYKRITLKKVSNELDFFFDKIKENHVKSKKSDKDKDSSKKIKLFKGMKKRLKLFEHKNKFVRLRECNQPETNINSLNQTDIKTKIQLPKQVNQQSYQTLNPLHLFKTFKNGNQVKKAKLKVKCAFKNVHNLINSVVKKKVKVL